jgi:hypothetical protein
LVWTLSGAVFVFQNIEIFGDVEMVEELDGLSD